MKHTLTRKWLAVLLALVLALALAACGGGTAGTQSGGADADSAEQDAGEQSGQDALVEAEQDKQAETQEIEVPEGTPAVGGKIYVQGYEWGPGVPMVIMELPVVPETVTAEGATAATAGVARTVTGAEFSDADGAVTGGPSSFVALELETTYANSGSPFDYNVQVFMNQWKTSYPVVASVVADGVTYVLNADLIDSRVCPETEAFTDRNAITAPYTNPMTGEEDAITLRYAATAPASLAEDGVQNPLIIWLHGQGEGGTDVDIELIGNEVVALNRDEIQSQFTTEGGADGAYVLAVQCETYWMDGGDGTNSNGDLVSRYTEALMDTIQAYVAGNTDVDPNRVYLGGCSNGGYMTMNMIITYPDYWAAAYPNCEAYAWTMNERDETGAYAADENGNRIWTEERWLTDEKVQAIKDIPIWFVNCSTDSVVVPERFSKPAYRALLQAGAENAWYSMFETAPGTDDPGTVYMSHFAWVFTFNNQVTGVQDRDAIRESTDDDTMGFAPTNDGGGTAQAVGADGTAYDNLFAWMNAQHK